MPRKLKSALLFVSLFYLTFYVPMALTFYLPWWMEANCSRSERCEAVGMERSLAGIEELSSYFRHRTNELTRFLTQKEKLHLKEVRGIFDKLLVVSLAATVLLAVTYDGKMLPRFALYNAFIVLALLAVLPFFGTFWRDVFHPLLFNNNLWMNTRSDLSYYIMPRQFFKYTVALIVAVCFSVNIALWLSLRSRQTA